MRTKHPLIVRFLVDEKFDVITKAGETVMAACRNAAIHIPGNCLDSTCRDCIVQVENPPRTGAWETRFACLQHVVDDMKVRRITPTVTNRGNPSRNWRRALAKLNENSESNIGGKRILTSEDLIKSGESYTQATGVELKFDLEKAIDWERRIKWTDIDDIVARCMVKYPSVVPSELSEHSLVELVRSLPGFQDQEHPEKQTVVQVSCQWSKQYAENLEMVIFSNLSSYEP